jgi:hypothetical protein
MQLTEVAETQLDVLQIDAPILAVGDSLFIPKFMPETVTVADPVVGPLPEATEVVTLASYVKMAIAVPT